MSEWKASGRIGKLLDAMRADPERVFMAQEAGQIMGCHPKYVYAAIKYAVANKAMYSKGFGPGIPMLMRGAPFPDDFKPIQPYASKRAPIKPSQTWKEGKERIPDKGWLTDPNDPRIGKVVENWKPPVMRHVRGGA